MTELKVVFQLVLKLFNQIHLVDINSYFVMQSSLELMSEQLQPPLRGESSLMVSLSMLLSVGVEFLSSSHSVQFTGLVLINKIIDVAVAVPSLKADKMQEQPEPEQEQQFWPEWREVINQEGWTLTNGEDGATTVADENLQRLISRLLSEKIHAGTALSLVLNANTLHRRGAGSRLRCTPSLRTRQCSYHCLQILSARVLLFLAQSSNSRAQLMEEVGYELHSAKYSLSSYCSCFYV